MGGPGIVTGPVACRYLNSCSEHSGQENATSGGLSSVR
jgi:hypothetical protein